MMPAVISKREQDARIQGEIKRISLAFLSAGSAGFTPSRATKAAGLETYILDFHPVLLLIASQVDLARGPEPLCLRCFSLYGPEDGGGGGQREEGRDFGSGWGEHWQFKGRAGGRWATSHQWDLHVPSCAVTLSFCSWKMVHYLFSGFNVYVRCSS